MSLFDYVIKANELCPDKLAIYTNDSAYSYGDIYRYSNLLASQYLKEYRNSNVLIHACNSNEFVLFVYSLLLNNCTIIPVSITCSEYELDYIIKETTPSFILVDEYTLNKYNKIYTKNNIKAISMARVINHCHKLIDCGDKYNINYNSSNKNENNTAFIIYSSGSTGDLKGVKCNHKAIKFAVNAINEVIQNKSSDKILCALPFSFDYGLYQIFLSMSVYATLYIHNSLLNPLQLPSIIEKNKITGFPAIPMWLNILYETRRFQPDRLSSLKYITSTGDVLKENIIDYLICELPNVSIYPMYGLTECKRVSILTPDAYNEHKGSVGLPLRGTEIRIVDNNGKDVKQGEIGELVVSGPHLMDGYYNDEQSTKKRYKYNDELQRMELYTGDLFKMDKEGYLYFISRTQFFIKKRGQRLSPIIIEKHVNKIPGVIDSVAVPVRLGDKELLVLFIRIKDNSNLNDIIISVKKDLPNLYVPDHVIHYTDSFPYNSNGKLDRKKLIEKAITLIKLE